MERVQFQQEQMLEELKDLVDKGLFTETETKQILKKRTQFESMLVRRVAKKGDFLRYVVYEMGLEELRKKRKTRMKLPSGPTTVSDYGLVRRQFDIFERAVKKFKSDVGLWIEYIELAKREGARALVGRIFARAIQLHPNNVSLYILAAAYELEQQSPSAARTVMQRGLRLNGESVELWREYVKMELGFMESIRRRWEVLGIEIGEEQRQVMEGGIVESVISNTAHLEPVRKVIAEYPMDGGVRKKLLDVLDKQEHAVQGIAELHMAASLAPPLSPMY